MDTLKTTIERQILELTNIGYIKECRDLNVCIKAKGGGTEHLLEGKALPMHFSGDLFADLVFIELNPGFGDLIPTISGNELVMAGFTTLQPQVITDFTSYNDFFKNLGASKALDRENQPKPKGVSTFDQKLWHFLRGLELPQLPLRGDKPTHDDTKRIRSNILQLEIVPFMSRRFSFDLFDREYLSSRIKRIKEIVRSHPRKHVFIAGNERIITREFEIDRVESFEIDGRKNRVTIGFQDKQPRTLFHIRSYKVLRFNSQPMQNYGRLCKEISLGDH